jgi:predicted AlkP superfamily pyrophosphatase or phosphodiesterase
MLPALPANFGRLTDVFVSALGAITGNDNRLKFRSSRRVVSVLVDGLGAYNLKAAGGHAPLLNQALAKTKPISCGFPSTTVTSITSFATGVSAGTHGLLGYKLYDRDGGVEFNLLNGWDEVRTPEAWQTSPTVASRALQHGVGAFFIGPAAYADSDFTRATMSGATYRAAKTIADRFDSAIELLNKERSDWLCYLYIPELDQLAHNRGVSSSAWLNALEELEAGMKRLAAALGKSDGALLTADHGVIDVKHHQQIMLDEVQAPWDRVACVAGDPRVNFIYLDEPSGIEEIGGAVQNALGDRALVLRTSDLIGAGWFGDFQQVNLNRLPELMVLAVKNVALYHRGFAPAASLNMIGQHGGLNPTETAIPLLGFGSLA